MKIIDTGWKTAVYQALRKKIPSEIAGNLL
jgi:hypothetical protein